MGQYFIPANTTKKIAITRNSKPPMLNGGENACWSNIIGFLKIMEHGYKTNPQVMLFLDKLQDEWFGDRIVWHGDYAANSEYSHYEIREWDDATPLTLQYAPFWEMQQLYETNNWEDDSVLSNAVPPMDEAIALWYADKALVNLDDGCYIHLGEHYRLSDVSPLPILTSTSTSDDPYVDAGRYNGSNFDLMGTWHNKRLGVMRVDDLKKQYPEFRKWNVMFTDEAGGTIIVNADDPKSALATVLGNKGKANKKTGEFISYAENLITPLPSIEITKLSTVIKEVMEVIKAFSLLYWEEVDKYFGVTSEMLRLIPRRLLLYILNIFRIQAVTNDTKKAVKETIDNAQKEIDEIRLQIDIEKISSTPQLPQLGHEWKNNNEIYDIIEHLTTYLKKHMGDVKIYPTTFDFESPEGTSDYSLDAAGYVKTLLNKMNGRTVREIIREDRLKYFPYSEITVRGASVSIDNAHDISDRLSFTEESNTHKFRIKLSSFLEAVFEDMHAGVGCKLTNGAVTHFEPFEHTHLESIRMYKNGKVSLKFKRKEYAAKLYETVVRKER